MEGAPDVAARTRSAQVVRCAENRVVRIVDVSPEPVRAPARRHELHRPLRTGGARAAELPERGLDEVDRGEDAPRNTEAPLALAVEAEQISGRPCRTNADCAPPKRRRDRVELAMSGDHVACEADERRRQPQERR